MKDENKGLRFRLSQGAEQSESATASNVATASPLSDSETQNVLKRLPPIKAEATDEQDFALREKSLPPPRTGQTINISFPPPVPTSLPDIATASGPFEVLRFSPEGEVPIAPQLSVTFSQPMVAVTSQTELAAQDSPVRLTPQPKGRWRWVGTKTLLFEPEERFPMATEYLVTVPAGTKSANGGTLSAERTWRFATPPPQVKTSYPPADSVQRRDTLMYLEFDQRVDPESVLRTMKITAGGREIRARLATPEEIAADELVSRLSKNAELGRWLAFRAVDASGRIENPLPADANVTITVGPNTPSLEGTRTTTKAETFSFKTYGPLRVEEHRCGYEQGKCTPFDVWTIVFNNPLDANAFQNSQIRVEPAAPGLKMEIYGNTLQIKGAKQGRTDYKVTLDASLRDQFGQTLGKDQTLTFKVGSAPPMLTSSAGNFVVLDPVVATNFRLQHQL